MENLRSSSPTHEKKCRNQSFRRRRNGKKERTSSLPVKDRTKKTNLPRSCSSQLLLVTGRLSLYFENFHFTQFDISLLKNSLFTQFLLKVNCPFCLEIQEDKTVLIKHLGESCSMKMKKRSKLYAPFQILPTNAIKCNICPNIVLTTIATYFFHLYDDNHTSKCTEFILAGKEFTDFLYCTCCKMLVLNNYTQLQSHVENKIHQVRSRSSIKSDYFMREGIYCVYCFHNSNKRFKCLLCNSNFLFKTPWDIFGHLESSSHKKNLQKNILLTKVYCCFCDEEVSKFEIPFHFASDEHMENENSVTAEGSYELCLYCGFTCSNRKDLFAHMKLSCNEITKIRQKEGWELHEDLIKKKDKIKEHKFEMGHCILVKKNMKISKMLRFFAKFGNITCVKKHDDEYVIIEFSDDAAVGSVMLVQDYIKIHHIADIKFLNEKGENDLSKGNTSGKNYNPKGKKAGTTHN